jgi:hypothetical protein
MSTFKEIERRIHGKWGRLPLVAAGERTVKHVEGA